MKIEQVKLAKTLSESPRPNLNPEFLSKSMRVRTSLKTKESLKIKESSASGSMPSKSQRAFNIEGFIRCSSGADLSKVEVFLVNSNWLQTQAVKGLRGEPILQSEIIRIDIQDLVSGYFSASVRGSIEEAFFAFAKSKDQQLLSRVHILELSEVQSNREYLELTLEERKDYRGMVVDEQGLPIPNAIVMTASQFVQLDRYNSLQRLLYGFMSRENLLGLVPIPPGGQAGPHFLPPSVDSKKAYVYPEPTLNQLPFPLSSVSVTDSAGRFQVAGVLQSSEKNLIHVFAKGYTQYSGLMPKNGEICIHRRRGLTVKVVDSRGVALTDVQVSLRKTRSFGSVPYQSAHDQFEEVKILKWDPEKESVFDGVVITVHDTRFPGIDPIHKETNSQGMSDFPNLAIKAGWVQASSREHGVAMAQFKAKDKSLVLQLSGTGALKINATLPPEYLEKIHFKAYPVTMKNIEYTWRPGDELANSLPAGPLVFSYSIGSFTKTVTFHLKEGRAHTVTISDYPKD